MDRAMKLINAALIKGDHSILESSFEEPVNGAGLLTNDKSHEQMAADAAEQINVNFTEALSVARHLHYQLEQAQGTLQ